MTSRTAWLFGLVFAVVGVTVATELSLTLAAVAVVAVASAVFVPLRSLPHEIRRLSWETGMPPKAWLAGAVAFAAGIVAMHVLGSPEYSYDCSLRAYRRCKTAHFWTTMAFFAGVVGATISVSYLPPYRLVSDAEESTASTASEGDVLLSGEIAAADDVVEAPFTGEEAVCVRYGVLERYNERLFDDGSWHTVDAGQRTTPFYVDDGTDRVLVDPSDGYLTLNTVTEHGPVGDVSKDAVEKVDETHDEAGGGAGVAAESVGDAGDGDASDGSAALDAIVSSGRIYQVDTEVEVAADDEPPERVERWRRENDGVFPLFDRDRRYQESLLRPGDEVAVAGPLENVSHGYPERRVVGADGAPVKVAAGDADDVSTWLTGAVWIGGAIGAILTPLGFLAMYLTL